ncbi:MAG: DNA-binding response regulator [Chitinophagaceae bacterium]|nr:DNA-binding response regulator [Chitinophagaceae bacterium]MDB5222835.1 DNA-binding response regulator [Chitinophagaceae bacterium]
MANILLADDHEIIRSGLKIFIEHHMPHAVIDEAWDGNSAFEKIKEKDYQLIILDVNMPHTDSFGLVSNIIALRPEANILMFSMNAEDIYAKKYLQLGVKGYLSKASSEAEIRNAIDNVINAKKYISPELMQMLTEEALGKRSNNPFDDLSPREFEIVMHLIRGESISEICQALTLHSSTVGTFKARIFQKLHCTNIIDLLAMAKAYNIISPD